MGAVPGFTISGRNWPRAPRAPPPPSPESPSPQPPGPAHRPRRQAAVRHGGALHHPAAARRLPAADQPALVARGSCAAGSSASSRETDDAATVIIRPGWGWSYTYQPGQYVGIGVSVDGRWHWRSYSLTSPPKRVQKHIAITVKAMPEGFLSGHLVRGLEPGTIVRLALAEGRVRAAEPAAAQDAFRHGGQRHHARHRHAAHPRPARAPCPTSSWCTPRRPRPTCSSASELHGLAERARGVPASSSGSRHATAG